MMAMGGGDKTGLGLMAMMLACALPLAAQSTGVPAMPSTNAAAPVQTPAGTAPAVSKSDARVHADTSPSDASSSLPRGEGVLVDQVIAVVNGDLVLESDVDEDKRFQAFQPYSNPNRTFSRQAAIERLIDRTLILQQAKLQPDAATTDAEVQMQLQALRKEIPACKEYHCETDAGWAKFVAHEGFTVEELNTRWKQRMQVLKFIEIRFRSGIDITPAQIQAYYDTKLLPEYAKRNATAPKLAVISDRIQEILLQQQVSALLADWLKSLKAQGTVRVMTPGGGNS
jgi:peptidyl-prolyl cis-trans isomerase SurA